MIEAYPHGVYYWENSQGLLFEETIGNFSVDYRHVDSYVKPNGEIYEGSYKVSYNFKMYSNAL